MRGFRCVCANLRLNATCHTTYLWCHDARHACRLKLGEDVGRGMVIATQWSLTPTPYEITANSHCRIVVATHMRF